MARRPKGRALNGILLLDKPTGMSSNKALQQVKHLFKAQKAGHTGSLDGLATGLLPLCFGEATKISSFLLESDKSYVATCRLGQRTNTADADGLVIEERPIPALNQADVEAVLQQFKGEQSQIPPMYSALKKDGQPLYKLARRGIEVEREARQINIYTIELLDLQADTFQMQVSCSKGTYIRTLTEDIGEKLGCGAHIQALRRVSVGAYDNMIALDDLKEMAEEGMEAIDKLLLPLDSALQSWNVVQLNADLRHWIQHGNPVQVSQAPTSGLVRLLHEAGHCIGIGEILSDGRVAPKRLFNL